MATDRTTCFNKILKRLLIRGMSFFSRRTPTHRADFCVDGKTDQSHDAQVAHALCSAHQAQRAGGKAAAGPEQHRFRVSHDRRGDYARDTEQRRLRAIQ